MKNPIKPPRPPTTVIAVRLETTVAMKIHRLARAEDRTASNWCAGRLRDFVNQTGEKT